MIDNINQAEDTVIMGKKLMTTNVRKHKKLPKGLECWPKPNGYEGILIGNEKHSLPSKYEDVKKYALKKPWVWPNEIVHFLCDIHADTEAFLRSLVASNAIRRTGIADNDFKLTDEGRQGRVIIGGDCLDKGPLNLRLLRCIKSLKEKGAKVTILAGNHDLRTLAGFNYAGVKEPLFEHLLIRMGKKSIPLYMEIINEYPAELNSILETQETSDAKIRETLYPRESWYVEFPKLVKGSMPEARLKKELRRIREKIGEFEEAREAAGISLQTFYAALKLAQQLFLRPDGEFYWYFDEMLLAEKMGSFLFVHAGVDDSVAKYLFEHGIEGLNDWFMKLKSNNIYELYHGPLGNCFRTKYRDMDFPLTTNGIEYLHKHGVYAIVHGHRNSLNGQKIVLRQNMLNFECDASIDLNTRIAEGLPGTGTAVTKFSAQGRVLGYSNDHSKIKVFDPVFFKGMTTII